MIAPVKTSLAASAQSSVRLPAGAGRAVAPGRGMDVVPTFADGAYEPGYDNQLFNEYAGAAGSGDEDRRRGGGNGSESGSGDGRRHRPHGDNGPALAKIPDTASLAETAKSFQAVMADTDNSDVNSYRAVDRTIHGLSQARGGFLDLVV